MVNRPLIAAVGLVGSFSGKSRSRCTHEKRNSFTTLGPKMWVWLGPGWCP